VAETLLEVQDLRCGFETEVGYVRVVDGVSFTLAPGETVGLVGESGCGKTVSALAIMGLLPKPAGIVEGGSIRFHNRDLAATEHAALRTVRGRQISMIFQEPMTALNPVHSIGRQLMEALSLYEPGLDSAAMQRRATELLEQVGIPAPAQRLRDYPHQLSGGMRQRVMIAMAIAGNPEIVIADEPTTALDVTVQAQILELLRELQAQQRMALILITHDLGIVAEMCSEVLVMYAGRIAERAAVGALFSKPRHPYTRGLIGSLPRMSMAPKTPLPTIEGAVPGFRQMPAGCRFSNRCQHATTTCTTSDPVLESCAPHHEVACMRWRELAL
jgi:peptide/nickel transport system ATP-binding protein